MFLTLPGSNQHRWPSQPVAVATLDTLGCLYSFCVTHAAFGTDVGDEDLGGSWTTTVYTPVKGCATGEW